MGDVSTISDQNLLEALKIAYKTDDVKKADEIFDGERAFIIDDDNFITVFESESEFKKFYFNALKNGNVAVVIDFMNRYFEPDAWKKYVDKKKLREFLWRSIGNKQIGRQAKHEVERRPISSLKIFFPDDTPSNKRLIDTILLKHCDDKLFDDAIESALSKIGSRTVYVPEIDSFMIAYEWNKTNER